MRDIYKLFKTQIIFIVVFTFFKLIRRPVVEHQPPEWIKITLYSLPNFFEAIIGVLTLVAIGLIINRRILKGDKKIKKRLIYTMAPIIGGVYVITQELNLHSFIGGENVYDFNDIVFSIIGLIVGYFIVIKMQVKTT